MAKLKDEEVVTMRVLSSNHESNCSIARRFNVTEGAVRYHVRRQGAEDGRKKEFLIEKLGLAEAVDRWWEDQLEVLPKDRPPSIRDLHTWLIDLCDYPGSYRSVVRYARARYPKPKKRSLRRVETPPGAQSQSDWADRTVDVGDPAGRTKLHAFVMVLSHSRQPAVIWSRSQDQLAWHRCHNEAYRRLEGVAAVNRIDNLKTGIASGAGPWGTINEQYRGYARQMRFHVDATEVCSPNQKGKVERAVRLLDRLELSSRKFESLEDLQEWTDLRLLADSQNRICPATGKTVYESWQAEIPFLGDLPGQLPEPFDVICTRRVHQGCIVHFEGRQYEVPFPWLDSDVEIRGVSGEVHIHDPVTGDLLVRHPRHTEERIVLKATCHNGHTSDRIQPPRPFGKMSRKLQEIAGLAVEERPVDLYAALAEVAR